MTVVRQVTPRHLIWKEMENCPSMRPLRKGDLDVHTGAFLPAKVLAYRALLGKELEISRLMLTIPVQSIKLVWFMKKPTQFADLFSDFLRLSIVSMRSGRNMDAVYRKKQVTEKWSWMLPSCPAQVIQLFNDQLTINQKNQTKGAWQSPDNLI